LPRAQKAADAACGRSSIHGPRLIVEFAVQEPNHVHTIMRDPQNDYGMDWLGLHYEEHAYSGR